MSTTDNTIFQCRPSFAIPALVLYAVAAIIWLAVCIISNGTAPYMAGIVPLAGTVTALLCAVIATMLLMFSGNNPTNE